MFRKNRGRLPSHTNLLETFTDQFGFQAVGIRNGTSVKLAIFFVVEFGYVPFAIGNCSLDRWSDVRGACFFFHVCHFEIEFTLAFDGLLDALFEFSSFRGLSYNYFGFSMSIMLYQPLCELAKINRSARLGRVTILFL
jgi:hypothetical protein